MGAPSEGELGRPRTLAEAKDWMRERLAKRIHPMGLTDPQTTHDVINALQGLDGENWARAWISAGNRYFEAARDCSKTATRTRPETLFIRLTHSSFWGGSPAPTIRRRKRAIAWNCEPMNATGRCWRRRCSPSKFHSPLKDTRRPRSAFT